MEAESEPAAGRLTGQGLSLDAGAPGATRMIQSEIERQGSRRPTVVIDQRVWDWAAGVIPRLRKQGIRVVIEDGLVAMLAGTLAPDGSGDVRFLLRRPVSRAIDLASRKHRGAAHGPHRDRGASAAPLTGSYRFGIVQKYTLRPSTSSVCSGTQSPMSNACDTIRVPGFSSAFNLGRSFRFRLGSR